MKPNDIEHKTKTSTRKMFCYKMGLCQSKICYDD